MKRIKAIFLFLIILSLSNYTFSATPVAYASSAKADVTDDFHIKSKFEPWLWEKIQTFQSNGTMKDLSLVIRLVRDQRVTGMQIGDLKNYATSLFTESHNAAVYSCLLYTSPSPRDATLSRMPSSA